MLGLLQFNDKGLVAIRMSRITTVSDGLRAIDTQRPSLYLAMALQLSILFKTHLELLIENTDSFTLSTLQETCLVILTGLVSSGRPA